MLKYKPNITGKDKSDKENAAFWCLKIRQYWKQKLKTEYCEDLFKRRRLKCIYFKRKRKTIEKQFKRRRVYSELK